MASDPARACAAPECAPQALRLVLLCTHWREIGGSERYALWLARELAGSGHELLVLHEYGEPAPARRLSFLRLTDARSLRAELARFRPEVALLLTSTPRDYGLELMRSTACLRFVQDHTLFCPAGNKLRANHEACKRPMGLACFQAAAGEGCFGISGRGALGRMTRRWNAAEAQLVLTRHATRLLVASRWMREEVLRLGFEPKRVVLLPYPAMALERGPQHEQRAPDASAASPAEAVQPGGASTCLPGWVGAVVDGERSHQPGLDPPLILAAARLAHPDKGIDTLLTALGRLRAPFRAVIAGDGPARPWLESKAREEGLGARVHFAGWLDQQALARLYRAARVIAFPSVWDEPFGLVGLEAMAHARPVVTFDVGGVREWLVAGESGLAVPRGDAAAFAKALDGLLFDREWAMRMGRAGQARARERFHPDAHLKRLLEIIVEARPRGASGPHVDRA